MVKSSNKMWPMGEWNGKPLQHSCLENPMNIFFKKIRDTKGTFHAKIGTIRERNSMDLREADDKKRWQDYTEKVYRKGLNDLDNNDGMISHLELDTLKCDVKWDLGSIITNKASGGVKFHLTYFKS